MSDKRKIHLIQLLILIGGLTLWESGATLGLFNPFWTSSPRLLAQALGESLMQNSISYHLGVTLLEALSGLLAGSVCGVLLGLLLGMSRLTGAALEPFIIALNSLPRVALAPLIVMFVGIGFSSKFLLAFSLVIVPMMINTWEGIKAVDPIQLNLMKVMRANRWQLFSKVLLPNCVPWLFSGLRISLSFAIIGAIVGEFISARAGIGYMMDEAAGGFDTTGMLMPLFVLMLVSFALDRLILALSRHYLHWRQPAR
ncbi:ABC transporter permease [Erwiniaceae bacterium BAC15a-03b]|uniref:ABC transporter permease n=1 Tax=Winslowiella arboricola TaxID=2978220 RepID=A0A9J6PST8_9GAMM|nr:ABC transporter permease [Winslowiella arboricola]MCU5772440.1 ABC transporter permease [Winslowiella arboricola]MCU5779766.1 ABC transporter permease [Winslowiella arboricola]